MRRSLGTPRHPVRQAAVTAAAAFLRTLTTPLLRVQTARARAHTHTHTHTRVPWSSILPPAACRMLKTARRAEDRADERVSYGLARPNRWQTARPFVSGRGRWELKVTVDRGGVLVANLRRHRSHFRDGVVPPSASG